MVFVNIWGGDYGDPFTVEVCEEEDCCAELSDEQYKEVINLIDTQHKIDIEVLSLIKEPMEKRKEINAIKKGKIIPNPLESLVGHIGIYEYTNPDGTKGSCTGDGPPPTGDNWKLVKDDD